MNKSVKIEGLDCPNCARALEGEINKLEGINNAKIDFVKSLLTFESEDVEEGLNRVVKLSNKIEPNVKIFDKTKKQNKILNKQFYFDLSTLLVGIALGLVILLVDLSSIKALYWTLYVVTALILGYKTYYKAIVQLFKGVINENLLITISVIGATFVSEHLEGLMVIALYNIGKLFEGLAVNKSRRAIEKLAKLQPEYAVIINDKNEEEKVEPAKVKVNSLTIVKPGEKVAIDGVIVEGKSDFNMQSLTGESVPVSLEKNDKVLSGSIALNGVVKIKTTSEYKESAISKIMNMVEKASEHKSKTETFIAKLTKWYTLGIVALAIIVFGIVWAVTKNFNTAIYRGLIFLVISCPCAFAISVPLSYFSGLGNASKKGILIKGSNYLDECSKISTMAFDKTGTLTTGEFEITNIQSLDAKKTQEDILYLAFLGERYSIHPLARAITKACDKEGEPIKAVKEIAGEGLEYSYNKHKYFIGRKNKEIKNTIIEVYEDNRKIGEITLSDTIKNTAKATIHHLKQMGIKTCLLSGDNEESVLKVAKAIEIDQPYFKLLPEEKFELIKKFQQNKQSVGYVGDGINDAPSLTLANIGISMGINGSPASIEASDVVLVDDNPEKIVTAIKISKFTKKIVLENIILSAIIKIAFLALGAFGITGMLAAVFADVGVTLLAILNSMRALSYNPNKKKST